MRKFKIESTLINRDAIVSTVWSTIQQIVVAASTYFIVQAIQSVTKGEMALGLRYIGAFVASLILVYLPNTISVVYLQRWRLTAIDSFISTFTTLNFGKTTLGHDRNKVHAESWLTNECFTVYDHATDLLYQLYSTFMNSVLNILVIAAALDVRILFWYILAGLVLVISNSLFRAKLTKASADVQSSRKQLANALLRAWDNIFTGNLHNFTNWKSSYDDRLSQARTDAARYDLVRSSISSGAVIVALLIVTIGNGLFLRDHAKSLPSVAALFITLPRQLQIIQSIFAFYNLSLSWTGIRTQLKELQTVFELNHQGKPSLDYVRFAAIELFRSNVHPQNLQAGQVLDFEIVRTTLTTDNFGRFTLRAPNGAGKSTLLALLKESFAERAFYLPTNYADLAFHKSIVSHSDGNRLISVFNDILQLENIDFVILDEWDANLDTQNLLTINSAIDELARTKVVIESRHRI